MKHTILTLTVLLLAPLAAVRAAEPIAAFTPGARILFQGDSITDCGRNRGVAEPNVPAALGTGYPFLVAAAVLAERAREGPRFYNRGVSGDKVPDLTLLGLRLVFERNFG